MYCVGRSFSLWAPGICYITGTSAVFNLIYMTEPEGREARAGGVRQANYSDVMYVFVNNT